MKNITFEIINQILKDIILRTGIIIVGQENMSKTTTISAEVQQQLQQAIEHESPRGMILLSLSWIDHMLERRLSTEFDKGSRKEQEALFSFHGRFHSLSAKIKFACSEGWIGDDLHHDLELLRQIRNGFAHRIEPCSLEANEIREKLEQLKTPYEIYCDWADVRAAELPDGIVLYTGEKPEDADAELRLPGTFALKFGIPAVVGVLGTALSLELESTEPVNAQVQEQRGQDD